MTRVQKTHLALYPLQVAQLVHLPRVMHQLPVVVDQMVMVEMTEMVEERKVFSIEALRVFIKSLLLYQLNGLTTCATCAFALGEVDLQNPSSDTYFCV